MPACWSLILDTRAGLQLGSDAHFQVELCQHKGSRALVPEVTVPPLCWFVRAGFPLSLWTGQGWGQRGTRPDQQHSLIEELISAEHPTSEMLQVWGFTWWRCCCKIQNELCWGLVEKGWPLKQGRTGIRKVTYLGVKEKNPKQQLGPWKKREAKGRENREAEESFETKNRVGTKY